MNDPLRILLIEDDPADFLLLQRELKRGMLSAECTRIDTAVGLEHALQGAWDLVLSDYNVPGMEFRATLARAREALPDIPVILVSGAVGDELAVELLHLGVNDFVRKENLVRVVPSIERVLQEVADRRARVRAEEALRRSEETMRGIFRVAPTGIGIVADRVIRDVNATLTGMLGYRREELVGRSARILYPTQQDFEYVGREKYRQIASTGIGSVETRFRHKDGDMLDILLRSTPVDPADLSRGVVFTALDITQRKQAERSLRDSEARYRLISENSSDVIWLYDVEDDCFSYVSPSTERQSGFTPDEVAERGIFGMLTPDSHDKARTLLRSTLAAFADGDESVRVQSHEFELVRKDGTIILLEVVTTLVTDDRGGVTHVQGVNRDISERKRATDELRHREAVLNQIFDILPVGLWFADRHRRLVRANPAGIEIWGADPRVGVQDYGVFKARRLPSGEAIEPQDSALAHTIRDGVKIRDEMLEIDTFDGRRKVILNSTAPILDEKGDVDGAIIVNLDITERRQAEVETQQAHAILQAAMDQSPAGIAIADAPDGRLRYVNAAGLWIRSGDQASLVEGVDVDGYVDSWRIKDLDGRPLTVDEVPLARAIRHGETCGREFIVERNDGEERMVQANAAPIYDASGKVEAAIVVFTDITDSRQSEQALQQSEGRLRTLVNTIPDLVWLKDRDGVYLACNPRFETFFGAPEAEIIGKTDYDFVDHELADHFRSHDLAAMAARESRVQEEQVTFAADGHREILQTIKTPIFDVDGQLVGVLGIARDITALRQTEVQLRKLALAVEQSPESIVITNLDAEIEYVNESFERTTGFRRNEVVGRNPRVLKSGKTPRGTYVELWTALTEGRPWNGEFVNRRHDGSEYTESAIITPLRQDGGAVTHYVAVKQDVTETKRLELELQRHRHHLQELVDQRTAQLEEARTRAEAASLAKSTFLANMSHEIRTPMNAIIGLTHLLRQGRLTPVQAERLRKIDESAGHLLSVINDILDLSKIEAGKLALEQSDFHIGGVFDHVVSMLHDQAVTKGLQLVTKHDDVPPWLHGDPTRLRQALLNYAANAVKFTENGSIVLRAEVISEDGDDLLLRFEVQDTGIGIEPDKLERLFGAFEQADGTTSRSYGGTGLGLSITRRLAQLMGGEAGASSVPGKGSRFWMTACLRRGRALPPALSTGRTGDGVQVGEAQRGGRVLLAEDNAINREVAEALLAGMGLAVESVENGRMAVERIRNGQFDLVLMDVQMPEMDGLEATRLIRAQEGHKHVPILAMTANVFEDDRRACRTAGMDDFVAKPVEPTALQQTLVRWLPHRTGSEAPATPARHPAASAEDGADREVLRTLTVITGFDVTAGLRNLNGNAPAYLRLLRRFVSEYHGVAGLIGELVDSGDMTEAGALAHATGGAAGNLGLTSIAHGLARAEVCLREPADIAAVRSALAELDGPFQHLVRTLSDLPESPPVVNNAVPDVADLDGLLLRLQDLLENGDTAAARLYESCRSQLYAAFGADVVPLDDHIGGYDYPEALATLRSLSGTGSVDSATAGAGIGGSAEGSLAPPIDPEALVRLLGDDRSPHQRILRDFAAHAQATMAELAAAAQANETQQVAFLAHKFKSSARTVGADRLADLCAAAESACKERGDKPLEPWVRDIADQVRAIVEYIDADGAIAE